MKSLLTPLLLSLALVSGPGVAQQADDGSTLILVRPGDAGVAGDLVAFEALVGGETIEVATDFGFVQQSGDGYAILGVRTRIGANGLVALPCEGGLAPADLDGLFEGAYSCTGEIPVPVSYQPETGAILPNLIDPNGMWEGDAFFVSGLMSIKVMAATPISLPETMLEPLIADVPETFVGLVGRVAPAPVQASGACGEDVAVYFPLAALPACADAAPFDQE